MKTHLHEYESLIDFHENYRSHCINLVPSENILSPLAKKALNSDMGQRYYFKNPYSPKKGISYSYNGTECIAEILSSCKYLAKTIFQANYVSVYPISGHMANFAILIAFSQSGDTIICHDPEFGGYPGLDKNKLPEYLGLKVKYFPTMEDNSEMIDVDKTVNLIMQVKPKIIIFSSANTFFPIPIEKIIPAAKDIKATLVYDGSHPLGLIAGNQFQNPLREGVDILVGGTQKSFPGPQGAIIATNNLKDEIIAVEHFVMVDNPHFNRIAALAVSLEEMKHYGKLYAEQVVKNSKSLAKNLYSYGFPVCYSKYDFTESHMFKIQVSSNYQLFTKALERSNIIMDNAGRVGVNEMTRLGMKEKEMKIIASFINNIKRGFNPEEVKNEVIELREKFRNAQYC